MGATGLPSLAAPSDGGKRTGRGPEPPQPPQPPQPPLPPPVAELAAGRRVRKVWENAVGGLTFAVADGRPGGPGLYLKWAPLDSGLDYGAEAARLEWAAPFTPVPEVLEVGQGPDGSWMLLSGVPGRSAVDQLWRAAPAVAVRAIGEGLRALHHALPVENCPFSWSAEGRVAWAQMRSDAGAHSQADWHEEHRHLSVDQALQMVEEAPPVDRLVVCHGDACAPNTVIGDDGTWTGHVDFQRMGLADRWADLAIASWSCDWNYGPGWQTALLDAYGVDADPDRTAYYRLLWDLT